MSKYNLLYGFRNGSYVVPQTKSALLSRAIGCKKSVEILHSQLVRKGRLNTRTNYTHPTKGAIYTATKYNIHNNTSQGYDYNDPERLGIYQILHGKRETSTMHATGDWSTTDDNCHIVSAKEDFQDDYFSVAPGGWTHSIYNNLNGYNVLFYHPDYYLGTANEYAIIDTITTQIGHYTEWHRYSDGDDYTVHFLVANATVNYKIYKQIFDEATNTYSHEYLSDGSASFDFGDPVDDKIDIYLVDVGNAEESSYEWRSDAEGKISRLDFSAFYNCTATSSTENFGIGAINEPTGAITTTSYSNLTPKASENAYVSFRYNYPNAKKIRILDMDLSNSTCSVFFLDDGRILLENIEEGYFVPYDEGGEHSSGHEAYYVPYEYEYTLLETYNQSDNKPTRGNFNFAHDWAFHYTIISYDDPKGSHGLSGFFKEIAGVVIMIVAMAVAVVTQQYYVVGTIGSLGYASGMLGAASLLVTGMGIQTGERGLLKLGQALGIAAAVTGIASAISNIAKSVTTNTATAAANQSSLSAASVSQSAGMTQTTALYAQGATGTARSVVVSGSQGAVHTLGSWGGTQMTIDAVGNVAINTSSQVAFSGSSVSLTSSISTIYGANGSISLATSNALMSGSETLFTSNSFSSFGSSWFNTALEIGKTLKEAYGVYSDTKSLFKKPNDFSDDSMPTNEDENERAGWGVSENNDFIRHRFYDINEEYDLGLQPGTLLYTPSVRERMKK